MKLKSLILWLIPLILEITDSWFINKNMYLVLNSPFTGEG